MSENKSNYRHPAPEHPIQSNFDGISTLSVHAGEHKNRPQLYDTITTPVALNSTYWFNNTQQVIDFNEGRYQTFEYGRYGNPTVRTLEEKLAVLEAPGLTGIDALVSSSGMASVTNMLLGLLEPGSKLIITNDCYRRTRQFIEEFLPKMNITHDIIDPSDTSTLEKILIEYTTNNSSQKKPNALFFSESPTNPYCRVVDIETIVKICKTHNCTVCIDTTFATPVALQPLLFGVDLVLHSGTKYLGGHNDLLCGAVIGKSEFIAKVKKMQNILGPVLDPHAAYLVLRGLKTLTLRVQQASKTAATLAAFLEKHPLIERVHYPGLESHKDHANAKKHFKNGIYGGMLSFEVKGDFNTAAKFIDSLKIPYIAPSLGGVESLVEQPACMSFWNLTQEQRLKVGIKDNLVRFSCGVEDTNDVLNDITQALDKIKQ